MEVINRTVLDFSMSLIDQTGKYSPVTCSRGAGMQLENTTSFDSLYKVSKKFSIPADFLRNFTLSKTYGSEAFEVLISPQLPAESSGGNGHEILQGMLPINTTGSRLESARSCHDVVCRPVDDSKSDYFILQVTLDMSCVDDNFQMIHLLLEPRAVVENRLPVDANLEISRPYVFNSSSTREPSRAHTLPQSGRIEIFSDGPTAPILAKLSDSSLASGAELGWIDKIDLPIKPGSCLEKPFDCRFSADSSLSLLLGQDFTNHSMPEVPEEGVESDDRYFGFNRSCLTEGEFLPRKFYFSVNAYAVHHVPGLHFELAEPRREAGRKSFNDVPLIGGTGLLSTIKSTAYATFRSSKSENEITLLPNGRAHIRLKLSSDNSKVPRMSMVRAGVSISVFTFFAYVTHTDITNMLL